MSDAERNELRLMAHEIIRRLYEARATSALELLKVQIDLSLKNAAAAIAKGVDGE